MAFVRIWIHVVFGTKNRFPYFTKEIKASIISHIKQNAKTKEITGFTILNFSQKNKKSTKGFNLPIEVNLRPTFYP